MMLRRRMIPISVMVVTALYAVNASADTFTLLGLGVCRPAGENAPKVYSYKEYSWQQCKQVCEARGCFGIEFNVLGDRSVCEHHYAPVKLKKTTPENGVQTCWVRS
jgi:hypothetical protein